MTYHRAVCGSMSGERNVVYLHERSVSHVVIKRALASCNKNTRSKGGRDIPLLFLFSLECVDEKSGRTGLASQSSWKQIDTGTKMDDRIIMRAARIESSALRNEVQQVVSERM